MWKSSHLTHVQRWEKVWSKGNKFSQIRIDTVSKYQNENEKGGRILDLYQIIIQKRTRSSRNIESRNTIKTWIMYRGKMGEWKTETNSYDYECAGHEAGKLRFLYD